MSRIMLTSRRVKDCCATLHNCILKWKQLTETSFDLINKLYNKENYTEAGIGSLRQSRQDVIGYELNEKKLQKTMEVMVNIN